MLVCKCPHCGEEAVIDDTVTLTTFPPQYRFHCEHCDENGFVYCREAYPAAPHVSKKKIEKLKDVPCDDGMCVRPPSTAEVIKKINEIIDYLNSKGE